LEGVKKAVDEKLSAEKNIFNKKYSGAENKYSSDSDGYSKDDGTSGKHAQGFEAEDEKNSKHMGEDEWTLNKGDSTWKIISATREINSTINSSVQGIDSSEGGKSGEYMPNSVKMLMKNTADLLVKEGSLDIGESEKIRDEFNNISIYSRIISEPKRKSGGEGSG
jgi:hypothetical protein